MNYVLYSVQYVEAIREFCLVLRLLVSVSGTVHSVNCSVKWSVYSVQCSMCTVYIHSVQVSVCTV